MTMMDDVDTKYTLDESSSTTNRIRTLGATWRRILAVFVLLDIIGVWILMVRVIQHTSARSRGLRSSVFVGAVLFTVIGMLVERYLLPGVVAKVGKKLILYIVIALIALYVFYPAIEYLRGDDDIFLATIQITGGRKLSDAQKLAPTLRILNNNPKVYRVEVSKRDAVRLWRRSYRVEMLQSPEEQYRVQTINAHAAGRPNSNVEHMVHMVSSDSLLNWIRVLERYGTRFDRSPQADSAADYIAGTMKRYGLEVESLPFSSGGRMYASSDDAPSSLFSRNICGTLRGTGDSNAECIIVGHYDSVSRLVPGANDNASGVAAVLEAARICSQYTFAHTIRFLAVGAEEEGLIGSHQYAQEAKAKGRNIIAVINGDMLGYPLLGDVSRIALAAGKKWNALLDSALIFNRRYNLKFLVDAHTSPYGGSDQESFIQAGYPAVEISEGSAMEIWSGLDPYYHSPFDTSDKLSADLLRHCAQLMTVMVAEMAVPLAISVDNRH
jgi:hypothetical protein